MLVTFAKPTFTPAPRENWTLSCETLGGAVLDRSEFYVARGEQAVVTLSACAAALNQAIRIGSNRWYVKTGKSARMVFRVKGGKVREIGIVNKRFTSTRSKARRTLSAWRLR